MNDEIMVSICCTTYNHGKFIEQAIKGFIEQKTNFKYEIIIRDDASTDNTQEIIKDYEKKYPELIRGIYEKENTYSKGIWGEIIYKMYENAKGKYIAICEGDDYWCDQNKLQLQVDYMEQNPECTFCFHDAYVFDNKEQKIVKNYMPVHKQQKKYMKKNGNYNAGELALLADTPTASYFFRNEDRWPKWMYTAISGDTPMQIIKTAKGYGHYIDRKMCVYRINTGFSVTDSWRNSNIDLKKKQLKGFILLYENINKELEYEYNRVFSKIITEHYKALLMLDPMEKYNIDKNVKIKLNLFFRIKLYIKNKYPNIFINLKKIKKSLIK